MSTDGLPSREQLKRVLEWLAPGGVAWLVGSGFGRRAFDEDPFVESAAALGTPRARRSRAPTGAAVQRGASGAPARIAASAPPPRGLGSS